MTTEEERDQITPGKNWIKKLRTARVRYSWRNKETEPDGDK